MSLDMGSSSTRAIVYEVVRAGKSDEGQRRSYLSAFPAASRRCGASIAGKRAVSMNTATNTFDAEKYFEAVKGSIDDAMELLGDERVVSVGISCLAMSLVGLSQTGDPVTPVYTYADSKTGEEDVGLWRSFLEKECEGGARLVQVRTGTPIHSSYAPALLCRLQREKEQSCPPPGASALPRQGDADRLGEVRKWATLSSFVLSRLTGVEQPVTMSEASWTGLLDSRRSKDKDNANAGSASWDTKILSSGLIFGHRGGDGDGGDGGDGGTSARPIDMMPSLCDVGSVHTGGLEVDEYGARWPGLSTAVWARGVGDGAAANVGAGCISDGKVCVTIGTSAAMRACVNRGGAGGGGAVDGQGDGDDLSEIVPHGLWRYVLDEDKYLVGGALSDGGSAHAWVTRGLGVEEAKAVEEEAAKMKPDGHGLTILPFWSGERSPGYRSGARAHIAGMGLAPVGGPAFLRAVMEAVALRLSAIYRLLEPLILIRGKEGSLNPPRVEVFATGGALCASPLWQQILADSLGTPIVVCPALTEASSLGAALLGARGSGLQVDAPKPEVQRRVEPTKGGVEAMSRAFARQEELYRALYPPSS